MGVMTDGAHFDEFAYAVEPERRILAPGLVRGPHEGGDQEPARATLGKRPVRFPDAVVENPLDGAETGARVLQEGAWLRRQGIVATCFCGGGWYSDASVAAACATLGYVDCTPRAHRPPRLEDGGAWLELAVPMVVETDGGPMLAIPTTHSLGELVRLAFRPKPTPAMVVHGYFHDTDLLDSRRRRALKAALTVHRRRRTVCDLDSLAADVRERVVSVRWDNVIRGGAADSPE